MKKATPIPGFTVTADGAELVFTKDLGKEKWVYFAVVLTLLSTDDQLVGPVNQRLSLSFLVMFKFLLDSAVQKCQWVEGTQIRGPKI